MSIPTAIITIGSPGGEPTTPIPTTAVITRLDIIREVGKIASAEIVMVDGNPSIRNFRLSDGEEFIPGAPIEVKLRYEGNPDSEESVFKGIIIRHSIEATVRGGALRLLAKDTAVKMTSQRKKAVYTELTDKDLMTQLVENSGLEVGQIDDTEPEYPELVQFWCTDWDFLLARADFHGFWPLTNDGNVDVLNPEEIDTSSAQYTFEYGVDEIFGFKIHADAEFQYSGITASGWTIADQVIGAGAEANSYNPAPGDLDPATLAAATGGEAAELNSTVPMQTAELDNWAKGQLRKSRDSMVRGYLTVRGNGAIRPGEVVELSGMSTHFNGNVLITGVRHMLSASGWTSNIQFGRGIHSYVSPADLSQPVASGIIPAIQGLQIGIVQPFEEDPLDELRVKVKIPALGEEAEAVWARLLSPEAGTERGYFFRPEEGDEVVLGFLNTDPRFPVIMGGLYSSAIAPPVASDEITADNFIKGIYTKTGMQLSFDDENNAILLQTSDDQYISLHEGDEKLEIKDINGHTITLSSDGVVIKSEGDMTLEASGKVTISGSEVDVQ